MKVDVYWNLHRKCWSIRHKGKVIGHSQAVVLGDATFHVSKAGRQRVLRERRKNIHAFVRGTLLAQGLTACGLPGAVAIAYNPYRFDSFVEVGLDGFKPVEGARLVALNGPRAVVANGIRYKTP